MRSATVSISASFMPRDVTAGVDRKSTRLNSSHSSISYAVFCLKKKKKHEQLMQNQKQTQYNQLHELLQLAPRRLTRIREQLYYTLSRPSPRDELHYHNTYLSAL